MADVTQQIQTVQVAFTNTNVGGATPVFLGGVKSITVHTSADCYIDFDQPVATTRSYKLLASNTADTTFVLEMGLIRNLYVQGVSGSGTLYVVAIAG